MFDVARNAVSRAEERGASYADARIERLQTEDLMVRNGRLAASRSGEEFGLGVRVVANGAWGFAAAPLGESARPELARELADRALAVARDLARLRREPVELAPNEIARGEFATPVAIDPFALSSSDKLAPLFAAEKALGGRAELVVREATSSVRREEHWQVSSEEAEFHQVLTRTGAGIAAIASANGRAERRSFPSSFGGNAQAGGFERVLDLGLEARAPSIRDEAIQLCFADASPGGVHDLILAGNLLMLQIHESVGHATELDRALGCEADLAGHTFATIEKRGALEYGSKLVNLVADSTAQNGIDTRGFDDDGVRSERWHLVRDGRFVDYQTNREWAAKIGARASHGSNRAQSWYHPPIVRITNLSLEPGTWSFEDLIADTDDGILCDTVKMWSIDQRRWNFQFTAEIGWEIRGGKRTRMLRTPTYQGTTVPFWNSCDAICDARHFAMWGVTNCGKGNPMQEAEMSHGASPARFRRVNFLRG